MAKAAGSVTRDAGGAHQKRTGLRARSAADFKSDTVRWFLVNSEDVGDIAAMLTLAMTVGFGVTGVMLYMFTYEHQKQYAVLKAMGAQSRTCFRWCWCRRPRAHCSAPASGWPVWHRRRRRDAYGISVPNDVVRPVVGIVAWPWLRHRRVDQPAAGSEIAAGDSVCGAGRVIDGERWDCFSLGGRQACGSDI